MALRGDAFLTLWNDVEPGRETEYERWHSTEHVPERVSIPGMLAARRYIGSTEGRHRFLTLYDAASLDVFSSPAYLTVAEQPTAWSLSMRRSLRGFHRVPCTTVRTTGRGLAGHAVALRFSIPHGATLPPPPFNTAFHLGEADPNAAFPIGNAEAATPGRRHVLVVEAGLAADLAALELAALAWLDGASTVAVGRYALISALRDDEVDPTLWQTARTIA